MSSVTGAGCSLGDGGNWMEVIWWETVTLCTVAFANLFWTLGHHHVDFALGSCNMHSRR